MPITLNQMAQQTEDEMKVGVFMALFRFAPLLEIVPFTNIDDLSVTGVQWARLPVVAFRRLNDPYADSEGLTKEVVDRLFPLGTDIHIDRLTQKTAARRLQDPAVMQTAMTLKSAAFAFNNYFINGDPTVNAKCFTGLKYRIAHVLPSRQTLYLDADGDGTGEPLHVWASDATQHQLLDALDELIDAVGGKADVLCMNAASRRGINSILRRQGLLQVTKDMFGRNVYRYGEDGPMLVDMGYDDIDPDTANEIITSTEDGGDADNDCTSIYAARFGLPDGEAATSDIEGLHGIQLEPIDVYDPLGGREMETKPARMLRMDWAVGLAMVANDFSAARAQGINWEAS